MIEICDLTKRFGKTVAVDGLTFTVQPGLVTGFLGPNGAGKTSTLRMLLGLDRPTSGRATFDGRPYAELQTPLREVGVLLDAQAVHGGRKAHQHLLCLAHSNGIPPWRVDEVLQMVGLDQVAGRRIRGFSLGMRQRLGIAAAMLGDPATVIFDEPINGLDPEGIQWIRSLVRDLAREGRTVLVSSHLMSEMALTADHLIIIGRGRLLADTSVEDLMLPSSDQGVLVRTTRPDRLVRRLTDAGAKVRVGSERSLLVFGLDGAEIFVLAGECRAVLSELTPQRRTLEELFLELTHDSVEFGVREGAV